MSVFSTTSSSWSFGLWQRSTATKVAARRESSVESVFVRYDRDPRRLPWLKRNLSKINFISYRREVSRAKALSKVASCEAPDSYKTQQYVRPTLKHAAANCLNRQDSAFDLQARGDAAKNAQISKDLTGKDAIPDPCKKDSATVNKAKKELNALDENTALGKLFSSQSGQVPENLNQALESFEKKLYFDGDTIELKNPKLFQYFETAPSLAMHADEQGKRWNFASYNDKQFQANANGLGGMLKQNELIAIRLALATACSIDGKAPNANLAADVLDYLKNNDVTKLDQINTLRAAYFGTTNSELHTAVWKMVCALSSNPVGLEVLMRLHGGSSLKSMQDKFDKYEIEHINHPDLTDDEKKARPLGSKNAAERIKIEREWRLQYGRYLSQLCEADVNLSSLKNGLDKEKDKQYLNELIKKTQQAQNVLLNKLESASTPEKVVNTKDKVGTDEEYLASTFLRNGLLSNEGGRLFGNINQFLNRFVSSVARSSSDEVSDTNPNQTDSTPKTPRSIIKALNKRGNAWMGRMYPFGSKKPFDALLLDKDNVNKVNSATEDWRVLDKAVPALCSAITPFKKGADFSAIKNKLNKAAEHDKLARELVLTAALSYWHSRCGSAGRGSLRIFANDDFRRGFDQHLESLLSGLKPALTEIGQEFRRNFSNAIIHATKKLRAEINHPKLGHGALTLELLNHWAASAKREIVMADFSHVKPDQEPGQKLNESFQTFKKNQEQYWSTYETQVKSLDAPAEPEAAEQQNYFKRKINELASLPSKLASRPSRDELVKIITQHVNDLELRGAKSFSTVKTKGVNTTGVVYTMTLPLEVILGIQPKLDIGLDRRKEVVVEIRLSPRGYELYIGTRKNKHWVNGKFGVGGFFGPQFLGKHLMAGGGGDVGISYDAKEGQGLSLVLDRHPTGLEGDAVLKERFIHLLSNLFDRTDNNSQNTSTIPDINARLSKAILADRDFVNQHNKGESKDGKYDAYKVNSELERLSIEWGPYESSTKGRSISANAGAKASGNVAGDFGLGGGILLVAGAEKSTEKIKSKVVNNARRQVNRDITNDRSSVYAALKIGGGGGGLVGGGAADGDVGHSMRQSGTLFQRALTRTKLSSQRIVEAISEGRLIDDTYMDTDYSTTTKITRAVALEENTRGFIRWNLEKMNQDYRAFIEKTAEKRLDHEMEARSLWKDITANAVNGIDITQNGSITAKSILDALAKIDKGQVSDSSVDRLRMVAAQISICDHQIMSLNPPTWEQARERVVDYLYKLRAHKNPLQSFQDSRDIDSYVAEMYTGILSIEKIHSIAESFKAGISKDNHLLNSLKSLSEQKSGLLKDKANYHASLLIPVQTSVYQSVDGFNFGYVSTTTNTSTTRGVSMHLG